MQCSCLAAENDLSIFLCFQNAFKCQHSHGGNGFMKRFSIKIIFVPISLEKSWLSFIFITSVPSIPSMRKYWVLHSTCNSSFPSGSLFSSCQKTHANSPCSVWMGHCHPVLVPPEPHWDWDCVLLAVVQQEKWHEPCQEVPTGRKKERHTTARH